VIKRDEQRPDCLILATSGFLKPGRGFNPAYSPLDASRPFNAADRASRDLFPSTSTKENL
jgi:hypothetical protein